MNRRESSLKFEAHGSGHGTEVRWAVFALKDNQIHKIADSKNDDSQPEDLPVGGWDEFSNTDEWTVAWLNCGEEFHVFRAESNLKGQLLLKVFRDRRVELDGKFYQLTALEVRRDFLFQVAVSLWFQLDGKWTLMARTWNFLNLFLEPPSDTMLDSLYQRLLRDLKIFVGEIDQSESETG